jgi:hypothetical protein
MMHRRNEPAAIKLGQLVRVDRIVLVAVLGDVGVAPRIAPI